MNLSNVIRKVEGYDWEEKKPFEVRSAVALDGGIISLVVKPTADCGVDTVASLVGRLYAYRSDKRKLIITDIKRSEESWSVDLMEIDNPEYEKKEEAE